MTTPTDLATTARLLGDPARAAMVLALMGGTALSAGELARLAGITAATASGHLKQLVAGGHATGSRLERHAHCASDALGNRPFAESRPRVRQAAGLNPSVVEQRSDEPTVLSAAEMKRHRPAV